MCQLDISIVSSKLVHYWVSHVKCQVHLVLVENGCHVNVAGHGFAQSGAARQPSCLWLRLKSAVGAILVPTRNTLSPS